MISEGSECADHLHRVLLIADRPVTLSAGAIMGITIPVGLLLIALVVIVIICCCCPIFVDFSGEKVRIKNFPSGDYDDDDGLLF